MLINTHREGYNNNKRLLLYPYILIFCEWCPERTQRLESVYETVTAVIDYQSRDQKKKEKEKRRKEARKGDKSRVGEES